jgi:alpha-beta hydrolase superfamily lysophospholipase
VGILGCLLSVLLATLAPLSAGAQVATPTAPGVPGRVTDLGVIRDPTFAALLGATADFGYYSGGAYRIEVPSDWNGGLVIFAHGYRGETPDIFVSDSPLREHLIAGGYAWAASSYRGNSYRPDWGVDDTLALRDLFIQRYGAPRWTILHGQSMGGHVLVASLEQHPGIYQAALAECGVLTGIGEFDYLGAYTAAAEYLSGVPLLDAPDAATFGKLVQEQWLPAMGTPGNYTPRGEQFDSVVKYLTGGDLPFREQGLAQYYLRDLALLRDPSSAPPTAPARRAMRTSDVVFQIDPGLGVSAEALNAGVRRYDPAPGARSPSNDPVFSDFTGQIEVPVLSLHDTGDAFVPFRFEQDYRRKTIAAGTGELFVQRAIRRAGHCNFSDAERSRAFDDLVAWLEQGTQPAGDDVLTDDLAHLGLDWTSPLEPDDPLAGA